MTDIRDHQMHTERFTHPYRRRRKASIGPERRAADRGRGHHQLRTLEYAADDRGMVRAGQGSCDLFIYPGYRFKTIDAMITNFHLPKSTLLMLVSAFAGMDSVRRAYADAVAEKYRFFSYGDAMLIS